MASRLFCCGIMNYELRITNFPLATDLQSVADIKAICNCLANYKFAHYALRIANP